MNKWKKLFLIIFYSFWNKKFYFWKEKIWKDPIISTRSHIWYVLRKQWIWLQNKQALILAFHIRKSRRQNQNKQTKLLYRNQIRNFNNRINNTEIIKLLLIDARIDAKTNMSINILFNLKSFLCKFRFNINLFVINWEQIFFWNN